MLPPCEYSRNSSPTVWEAKILMKNPAKSMRVSMDNNLSDLSPRNSVFNLEEILDSSDFLKYFGLLKKYYPTRLYVLKYDCIYCL